MKKLKNNKGFTLIELLVVMLVLVTIGTIVTGTFMSALRGGNKGNNINDIRQNGNFIIAQMSKMIAYAQEFEGVSSTDTADASFSTTCSDPTTVYKYIKIKSFDGGETIFSCDVGNKTIASGSSSLIDTTKMNITSCVFLCLRSSTVISPTLDISFTLQSANMGNNPENNTAITFETGIKPRN